MAKKNNERLLKESQLHVQGPQEYTTSSLRTTTTDTKDSFKSPSQPYYAHATKLSDYSTKIVFSLGSIFLCLFIGAVFYHINEGWDFTMAFYFCVVTMCTVGYGDTPLTKPSSRAFTIFFIMSSCVLVTLAIGNVAHISIQIRSEKKKLRMLNRKLDFNFLRELDMGDNGMDKTMFLVAMLVQQELVKKEKDVDPWLAKFDELDVNGDGVIDFDDAIDELQNELILEAGPDFSKLPYEDNILGNLGTHLDITYTDNPLNAGAGDHVRGCISSACLPCIYLYIYCTLAVLSYTYSLT